MKKIYLLLPLFICGICLAQPAPKNFKLDGIPRELSWHNKPLDWSQTGATLTITGGKGSRLFVDPQGASRADSAPLAFFKPDETFLFSCKMKVDFNAVFDAGVLMIYANPDQWAKLCFEYTPQLKPMIVTVANNGLSDDNNHDIIKMDEVYVRIAGLGEGAYAFHYSLDGKYWNMVRYFHLDTKHDYKIGFLSQSPRGDSCKSIFTDIKYTTEKLKDLRDGS